MSNTLTALESICCNNARDSPNTHALPKHRSTVDNCLSEGSRRSHGTHVTAIVVQKTGILQLIEVVRTLREVRIALQRSLPERDGCATCKNAPQRFRGPCEMQKIRGRQKFKDLNKGQRCSNLRATRPRLVQNVQRHFQKAAEGMLGTHLLLCRSYSLLLT